MVVDRVGKGVAGARINNIREGSAAPFVSETEVVRGTNKLSDIIDAIKGCALRPGIVDRRVGSAAQKEPVVDLHRIDIEARDLTRLVDPQTRCGDRTRII